ncbi:MAG: hypothetical protein GQ544_07900 [Candidatus Aminicenantes bacterium]|nr:hypothetical protein [Candidatus Aminicenantes bacterium]
MNTERRQQFDRRTCPTKPLSRFAFLGKRKCARRDEEDVNYYVDRYNTHYLIVIASILILCMLDAYLTLTLIRFGGVELNPFMLVLMNKDIALALIVKYLLTVFCISFFLIHKNFKVFGKVRIGALLYGVLTLYIVLVFVEAFSFFKVAQILDIKTVLGRF